MRFGKKGIEMEVLVWYIIAIVVLIILLAGYFILRAKGIGLTEYIKNIFRFGGG